jgi:ribosomal protein S18 acetylase RimI-like enzyme
MTLPRTRYRRPPVGISVRPGAPDELDAVLSVWRRAEAEPSVSDDPESLRRLLARDRRSLLVAALEGDGQDGSEIVGTVIAAWDGWRGNLYRLAVLPEHRRRGVGLELVRHAELELRRQGAIRLAAVVVEDHDHATGFWQAAGYERQSLRLRFVKNLHMKDPGT